MSEAVVYGINIALLTLGSLQSLVMVCSFYGDSLENRSKKLFFLKIVVTTISMLCFLGYNLRDNMYGTDIRDGFNITLLSLAYAGISIVCYLYIEYLRAQIEELGGGKPVPEILKYISAAITVVGSILWIVSEAGDGFSGMKALTLGLPVPFEFGHTGVLMLIAIAFCIIIGCHGTLGARRTAILSAMPVLMLAATLAEPHTHGIELHFPAIVLEFTIIYTQHYVDMANRVERDEMADTKARLALATGRMQPHYIYNVLTTIYYLCESDPAKAQRAIGTFSEYLRSNLETMERQELVSFAWELGEIRHYLELEKLRFGDRLQIEYDIEADDFDVPPLSIQPLVENAVKHGIAPKEEGGTVRIVSRRLSDGGAQIRVRDDGAGFDINRLGRLDRTHEGIANVRERLRIEVGGEMTITSAPGKGTTVVVTLRPGSIPANRRRR